MPFDRSRGRRTRRHRIAMIEGGGATISASFSVAPDHPALAGHFPGNPIVPGVMLLQRVLNLLMERGGTGSVPGLANVKFLAPLRARQACLITISRCGAGGRFECRAGPLVIARGDIRWDSAD